MRLAPTPDPLAPFRAEVAAAIDRMDAAIHYPARHRNAQANYCEALNTLLEAQHRLDPEGADYHFSHH